MNLLIQTNDYILDEFTGEFNVVVENQGDQGIWHFKSNENGISSDIYGLNEVTGELMLALMDKAF